MGELGGTVTHIAPEIVTHKRVTTHADVYAFGIIMWELYTGGWHVQPALLYVQGAVIIII
jgi:hypothetical protein